MTSCVWIISLSGFNSAHIQSSSPSVDPALMEAVGLAVGVVSLYKAVSDILDRVESYKEYELDSQITIARYNTSKLRLQKWAEALGIAGGSLPDTHDPRLDDHDSATVITNILGCIRRLFDKVERTSTSLKLPLRQRTANAEDWAAYTGGQRGKFEDRPSLSTKSRLAWATGGHSQMSKSISNLESLVDLLYKVLTPHVSSIDSYQLLRKLDLASYSSEGIDTLLQTAASLKQDEAEKWLDAPKDDDSLSKYISLRLDGTCDWIQDTSVFSDWSSSRPSDSGAKFLWISGPAGFGKTILVAYLIRYLQENTNTALSYCFSSSLISSKNELIDVVRVWIAQMMRIDEHTLNLTHTLYHSLNTRRASSDNVWKLLRQISTQDLVSFTFVLDGLDEFRTVQDSRQDFLVRLKDAVAGNDVRIAISSRVEMDIEAELSATRHDSPRYTTSECRLTKEVVSKDLNQFSQHVVNKRLPRKDETFRQELSTQIVDRCEGMFLWIKLQQDGLRSGKSKGALREVVRDMPQGLSQVYERNWKDIHSLNEQDRKRAMAILRWLAYAYKPLSVLALTEALIFDQSRPDPENEMPDEIDDDYANGEIKGLCGSLIEIRHEADSCNADVNDEYKDYVQEADRQDILEKYDGEDNSEDIHLRARCATVDFTHISGKDFVTDKILTLPDDLFPEAPTSESAQDFRLAAACLRYLNNSDMWACDENGYIYDESFLYYACKCWWRHIEAAESIPGLVSDLVNDFMDDGNQNFKRWEKTYRRSKTDRRQGSTYTRRASAFYYACLLGLYGAMDHLYINGKAELNAIGGFWGTPLQAVSAKGDMIALRRLVKWGAKVGMVGGDLGSALNAAAYFGQTKMVKVLLNSDSGTSIPDEQKQSAIETASRQGHSTIVRRIIDNQRKALPLEEQTTRGTLPLPSRLETALRNAVEKENSNIAELLAEYMTDLDAQDAFGFSALHLAAENNHITMIDALTRRGAAIDNLGVLGTPIAVAAYAGHSEAVARLLSFGARLEDAGPRRLFEADKDLISDPLQTPGANVLLTRPTTAFNVDLNTEAKTVLGFAAHKGHTEVVKLLLEAGADVHRHTEDQVSYTALHSAVEGGHRPTAEVLLQYGSDVNSRDIFDRTPLHCASWKGYCDLIELLIQNGADVSATRKPNGVTPLYWAVQEGHCDSVECLLRHG